MAKIPLRHYTNQIEKLIEQGEIEQAIAHAKNILKAYPKHVETYRLLGKAYLESQRYSEASDILQRLLSVIPDDFISQLGMSIIREDEGNLDAAIWHMERAYEVQPFNPAVQDELRRLYGRRDGSEPPKIRLTRGALIRMYARGDLYPQAIAEIRSALSEDPQRLDLQVLLARMYYQTGQKVESAEVCSSLISKLPYCLEANRILAELLPGTSRAEDADIFQQRVFALDPYQAFISPTAPTAEQVADQAVMVEPFLMEDTMDQAQAPDWARNAGVEWQEEEQEDLPDWLNALPPMMYAADTALGIAAEKEETEQPTEESQAEDIIPDFMKNAGWTASDGTSDETQLVFSDEDEEGEAAPAEIPEWLQDIAPAQPDESDLKLESEKLDWLDEILPAESASSSSAQTVNIYDANTPAEAALNTSPESGEPEPISEIPEWLTGIEQGPAADSSAGEIPEWLKEVSAETTTPDEVSADSILPDFSAQETAPEENPAESAAEDEIPDWLQGFETTNTEPAAEITQPVDTVEMPASDEPIAEETRGEQFGEPASPAEMPEWLQSFTAESLNTTPPAAASIEEEPNEIPDWLKDSETEAEITEPETPVEAISTVSIYPAADQEDQTPPSAEGSTAGESLAAEVPDLNDMDAAMAWLEGLAVKQGADEAALTTAPEDRTETPPDWVQELETAETVPTDMAPAESQSQAEEPEPELPDRPQETPQPSTHEDEQTGGAGLAFVLGAAAAAKIPEWLRGDEPERADISDQPETSDLISEQSVEKIEETAQPEEEANEVYEAPTAEQPAPLDLTTELSDEVPDLNDMDAAMAWLESLAVKQGADEDTLITSPEERAETPPEWVQEISAEEPASEEVSPAKESEQAAAGNVETEPMAEVESAPKAEEAELPDWLRDMAAETPEIEQTTAQVFAQPEPESENLAKPEAEEAEIPDWLQETASQAPIETHSIAQVYDQAEEPESPVEPQAEEIETSTWINETVSEGPEADQPIVQVYSEAEEEPVLSAKTPADEADLPDWLLAMDTSDAEEAQPAAQIFDQPETEPSTTAEPEAEKAEIPDWMLKTRELKEPEPEAQVAVPPESEPAPDFEDMDAAMAWLEALAAKQGADEATLTTAPDERTDTPPEWLQKDEESHGLQSEASVSFASVEPETIDEAPQPEAQISEEVEPVAAEEDHQPAAGVIGIYPAEVETPLEAEAVSSEAPLEDDDEAFAWLESLAAKQGAEEGTLITAPEDRQETAPDWTQQEQTVDSPEPAADNEWVAEVPDAAPNTANEEELPDWLLLELADQEPQTSNQEGEAEEETREPSVDDWLRDLEKESEMGLLQDESTAKPAEEDFNTTWNLDQQPSTFDEEPVESAAPAAEITTLEEAQDAINRGRLDAALGVYNRFIQQGENLEETIHDLRDALYRYPIDINIWQAIGDAYARNNQLQEALDAYTKAEELLR